MRADVAQRVAHQWASDTFGDAAVTNLPERVTRVLEEAIELAQAEGVSEGAAHKLVAHVFAKPAGDPGTGNWRCWRNPVDLLPVQGR